MHRMFQSGVSDRIGLGEGRTVVNVKAAPASVVGQEACLLKPWAVPPPLLLRHPYCHLSHFRPWAPAWDFADWFRCRDVYVCVTILPPPFFFGGGEESLNQPNCRTLVSKTLVWVLL